MKQLKISFILLSLLATLLFYQNCSKFKMNPESSLYIRKTVTIKIKNYCPLNNYSLEEVFATNLSHMREGNDYELDSDRDGLSNNFENLASNVDKFNISSANGDTNGDGYSDGVTVSLGYVKDKQVNLRVCNNKGQDTDYDGLTDCEENVLRSLYNNPDTVVDSIPDGLEVRFGLNPLDGEDGALDFDNDLRSALVEVKGNTPSYYTDTRDIENQEYRYGVSNYKNIVGGVVTDCHDVIVDNVPVMETSDADGGNLVAIYLVEHKYSTSDGDLSKLKVFQIGMPSGALSNIVIEVDSVNDVSNQLQVIAVDIEGNVL